MLPSPRRISPLGVTLGAFLTPLLFGGAGLPAGWIFQGVFQFAVAITATVGTMHITNSLLCWLAEKFPDTKSDKEKHR